MPHRILAGLVRGDDPDHLRQLIREQANAPDDLLQTLNYWLSGLHIQWHGEECHISEGRGEFCLRIPDLSASPNPSSIAYLLDWKSRLTQMVGREKELKALHNWADAKAKISACLIVGEGGVGKTRLAFMLAEQLKEKAWQAGEAQGLGLERCWYTGSSGTLLVIDYPEQRPDKVKALLEALAVMPEPARKLRILLLSRNDDFLKKLTQSTDNLVAHRIELPSLAADDSASWNLFQDAWRRLQELKQAPFTAPPLAHEAFWQWQKEKDLHRRPLFILALAIRLMLNPNSKELGGKEIIRALTQNYEITGLKEEAKKLNVDEYGLVMLRALAAISGQLESEALRQLIEASTKLKLDIQLPTLRQLKETSLWIKNSIHALQPDLLSADLLHYALTELAGDQSGAWQYCGLEAATDIAVASSILGHLIHDAQNALDRTWPLPSLIDWVCQEPERCEKISYALNRNNLEKTLLPLAIATDQVLLARSDSPQKKAHVLNNLSVHLDDNGERKEALQAIRLAVEINEQLAKENFATYWTAVAISLNNLSKRLAENGECEAALQTDQRAVEIYEQLATRGRSIGYFIQFVDDLEREAALQISRRAVESDKLLTKENFLTYGPVLAGGLNTLALRLTDNGEREAALQAIRRAVEIYEQLAKEAFSAYGPDLAMSLNMLSNCLADNGEGEKALQTNRRAVETYEQLSTRGRSIVYVIPGIVLMVAGLLLMTLQYWGRDTGIFLYFINLPWFWVLLVPLTGLCALYGGIQFIRVGARVRALSAEEILAKDRRHPVLYLRSFSNDSKTISTTLFKFGISQVISDPRLEELLVPTLLKLGPVIAIGMPGETLPELGAARLQVGERDWQQEVLRLMRRSQLVVVATGCSKGLLWEIHKAMQILKPTQILFVFSDFNEPDSSRRSDAYQVFREMMNSLFPTELPIHIGGAIFIRFSATWEPVLVGPPKGIPWHYRLHASMGLALEAVSPRFKAEWAPQVKLSALRRYLMIVQSSTKVKFVVCTVVSSLSATVAVIAVRFFITDLNPEQGGLLVLVALSCVVLVIGLRVWILQDMRRNEHE